MNYIIGCDAHKRYSQFTVSDQESEKYSQTRVEHEPGAIRNFLSRYSVGTPVALESVGNWYWIVDEIEEAGYVPLLAHAAKAKVMMGHVNKTDKLDADQKRSLPGACTEKGLAQARISALCDCVLLRHVD